MKKTEQKQLNTRVEFGSEFGDMNADKIYDTLLQPSKKQNKKLK